MKIDKLSLMLCFLALPALAATPKGTYRSIDTAAVPVWDEFVPASDKTDYADRYDMGDYSRGEWNWWNLDDEPRGDFVKDFWDPDVDYDSFERKTDREKLDRKKMILGDTRSCPYNDTAKCKKWLAAPHPINALPGAVGYIPTPREKTLVEQEIEELFRKKNAKKEHLDKWKMSSGASGAWGHHLEYQNCPFGTARECRIWREKPIVPETVANLSPPISKSSMDAIIVLSRAGNVITTDMSAAAPLVNRYRSLLAASRACCAAGLEYNLRAAGASPGLIYKFMVDDANFYQFGERCLTITDAELDRSYANTATAEIVADIRNTCLCRRKRYFESLLLPFAEITAASPSFANDRLEWKYMDGLKRTITVGINHDVNAVLDQLDNCPD